MTTEKVDLRLSAARRVTHGTGLPDLLDIWVIRGATVMEVKPHVPLVLCMAASSGPRPEVVPVRGVSCRPIREIADLGTSQWTVSWLWHISTNFAMRAARVAGFFASWTR